MKQNYEIVHNGQPNLNNMSKTEFNVFCKSLLDYLIDEMQPTEQSSTEEADEK